MASNVSGFLCLGGRLTKNERRREKCFVNYKFNFIFLYFDLFYQNNPILDINTCTKIIRENTPVCISLLDYNYQVIRAGGGS